MPRYLGFNPESSFTTTNFGATDSFTSLYLPFDTDLNDDSPNAHTVTGYGDAAISSTQAKFGGSSLALDGTGDRLEVSHSGPLSFGSGDFTIEVWVYATSTSGVAQIISDRINTTYSGFLLYRNGSSFEFYSSTVLSNSGSWDIASAQSLGTVSLNTWTHLAVTRSGNTFRCFQDGVQQSTFTSSATLATNITVSIGGRSTDQFFQGYLDDIRLIKSRAVYTANFTPPTTAVGTLITTNFDDTRTHASIFAMSDVYSGELANTWPTNLDTQYTSLYLPLTTDLLDASSYAHPMTKTSNVVLSTDQFQFSPSSLRIPGTSGSDRQRFLTTSASSAFAFGSNDFTVSLWYYPVSRGGGNATVFAVGDATNNHVLLYDRPNSNNTKFSLFIPEVGSGVLIDSVVSVSNGQWYHLAVTRQSNTIRLFVNGSLSGSVSHSGSILGASEIFSMGDAYQTGAATTRWADAFVQDVLVLNGACIYDGPFSVPSAPNGGGI